MAAKCPCFVLGPGLEGIPYTTVSPYFTISSVYESLGNAKARPCVLVCVCVSACVRACPRGRVTVSTLIDKVSWQRQQFLVNTGAGLAPQTNDAKSHSKRTVCKRCRIPKLNLFSDALFRISAAYRVLAFYAIETVWILFKILTQSYFLVNYFF